MTRLPEGFIPTRHRVNERVQNMLGRLHRLMPGIEQPDDARWREIGVAFMEGDPAMDTLLAAMRRHGMRSARAQFDQALVHGIDAVPDAMPELREFIVGMATPPAWLDTGRVERGAALFRRCGMSALNVGRDVALMGGYQASAFNRTLILTGALQKGATRRLAETSQWVLDCTAEGGLAPYSAGWRSTLKVRFIHALVRQSVAARDDWDMEAWGLPVNQPDMAATLYGSLTVQALGARMMGVPQSRRERDDLAHLTRYVGWLIGVDERWLADTEEAAAAQLMQLLMSLTNPDETSRMMAQPLAREPLEREYHNLSFLRSRFEYAKHLSISRAFLGAEAMERLGLPSGVLPWYPLATFPVTLARHAVSRALPGGRQRMTRRGRAAQETHVRSLTMDRDAVIGESVTAG